MMRLRILRFILVLFLISPVGFAQKVRTSVQSQQERDSLVQAKTPLAKRFSVGVDACGALMAAATSWGQYEAMLRLDFLSPFLPVVEAGLGVSNAKGEDADLRFKTRSPYFRLGCDYNFSHRSSYPGRIFAGVRYAFSPFSFDVKATDIVDPVYGTKQDVWQSGVTSSMHWLELVAGLETRIVGPLSLGWTFRYKFRLAEKVPHIGHAWYVPGYGRNDSHAMGGTFNVIIAL